MKKAMLTVFGKDRPGIIAQVTGILFKQGCNLEDISMTLLEGEFAMIMILALKAQNRLAIEKAFDPLRRKWNLSFFWRDLDEKLIRGEKHPRDSETHLVTVIGKDRTGIVYRTSRLLADFGLNITNLNSKILGYGKHTLYTMMLEVDTTRKFRLKKLEQAFKALAEELNIEIQLKPVQRLEL